MDMSVKDHVTQKAVYVREGVENLKGAKLLRAPAPLNRYHGVFQLLSLCLRVPQAIEKCKVLENQNRRYLGRDF